MKLVQRERMILSPDDRKETRGHVFISISPGKKTEISKRLTPKEGQINF